MVAKVRRAQAAMEFLMTYGWAILVVLAAIAALAYFGVLDPSKWLPERCTAPSGMDCIEKATIDIDTNAISFTLKNNQGYSVNLTSLAKTTSSDTTSCSSPTNVTVSLDGGASAPLNSSSGMLISNSQKMTFIVHCEDLTSGRVSAEYTLTYKSMETYQNHKAAISIRGSG